MTEHESSRTLVKSAPELWAECSDAAALARHLGAVGEIRITRLEPETTVAWEGAATRGTVQLEPAGWGTRVTLTMTNLGEDAGPAAVGPEPTATPEPEPASAPTPDPEPSTPAAPERPSWFARLLLRLRGAPAADPVTDLAGDAEPPADTPEPQPRSQTAEAPAEAPSPMPAAALTAALDSLGKAHHRPYSRA